MTARTTLIDKGRNKAEGRDVPYYYAFPFRFWMTGGAVAPDDVASWCRDQCRGYYKITGYTHNTSVRDPRNPTKYLNRIVYVDKVYLSDEVDAVSLRLTFDVLEVKVHRNEKMDRMKREDLVAEIERELLARKAARE